MLLRGGCSSADGPVGKWLPGTTGFCAEPKQPPEPHHAGAAGSGWPCAARGPAGGGGLSRMPDLCCPGASGPAARLLRDQRRDGQSSVVGISFTQCGELRASRGCHGASPSPLPSWPRCQGRSGFVPPGRKTNLGREKLNLDEAKPLEKAVGVHKEAQKCPRKDVPGRSAVFSWRYVAVKGQRADPEGTGQSRGWKGGGDDDGGRVDKDQPLDTMTMGASGGVWATAKPSLSRSSLVLGCKSFSLQMAETYRSSSPSSLLCVVSTCE